MRGSEFAELRAFMAVAGQGNFAAAARQLGVSASALSQTIRLLEERLGVRLFNRTTRSVALSRAGEAFLGRLGPVMDELDAAVADVSAQAAAPSGLLRINAPRLVAAHYFGPKIGPFLRAYPGITLELASDDRLVDIVAEGFDAGVRLGDLVMKDMIVTKLTDDITGMVVATPDYLAAHGVPLAPQDLKRHCCINFRMPTHGNLYRWEFERGNEAVETAVEGSLIVNDPDLNLLGALEGWELRICSGSKWPPMWRRDGW